MTAGQEDGAAYAPPDLVGTKPVPDPDKAAKLDGERDYPRSKGNLPKFRPRTGADGVFSHCSSSVA